MSLTTERRCGSLVLIQLLHGRTTTDCNAPKHPKSGDSEQVKA